MLSLVSLGQTVWLQIVKCKQYGATGISPWSGSVVDTAHTFCSPGAVTVQNLITLYHTMWVFVGVSSKIWAPRATAPCIGAWSSRSLKSVPLPRRVTITWQIWSLYDQTTGEGKPRQKTSKTSGKVRCWANNPALENQFIMVLVAGTSEQCLTRGGQASLQQRCRDTNCHYLASVKHAELRVNKSDCNQERLLSTLDTQRMMQNIQKAWNWWRIRRHRQQWLVGSQSHPISSQHASILDSRER